MSGTLNLQMEQSIKKKDAVLAPKWRNVFVLCTGRSGSMNFFFACQHIENYSSGHESRITMLGNSRFDYPIGHIEIDNTLSWMLGSVNENYGDTAFYVHLKRRKQDVVNSYNQRWQRSFNKIKFFTEAIHGLVPELLDEPTKLMACEHYYDTVVANIEMFLSNKNNKMVIEVEDINTGFSEFWKAIGAQGDLKLALSEFETKRNLTLSAQEVAQKEKKFRAQIKEKVYVKHLREAVSLRTKLGLRVRLALFKARQIFP